MGFGVRIKVWVRVRIMVGDWVRIEVWVRVRVMAGGLGQK